MNDSDGDELERLLAGSGDPRDARLRALLEAVREQLCRQVPHEAAARHLAALAEAARAATRPVTTRGWRARAGRLLAATTMKVAIGATAAAAATGGLAVTGNLPRPVEQLMVGVARQVGGMLPPGGRPQGAAEAIGARQSRTAAAQAPAPRRWLEEPLRAGSAQVGRAEATAADSPRLAAAGPDSAGGPTATPTSHRPQPAAAAPTAIEVICAPPYEQPLSPSPSPSPTLEKTGSSAPAPHSSSETSPSPSPSGPSPSTQRLSQDNSPTSSPSPSAPPSATPSTGTAKQSSASEQPACGDSETSSNDRATTGAGKGATAEQEEGERSDSPQPSPSPSPSPSPAPSPE